MSYPGTGRFRSIYLLVYDFCGATSGAKLMVIGHKVLPNWNWDFEMKSP